MPTNPTYPGVYIEELENPVKTIVGVSTSVTAFVGRALAGPTNKPVLIHNFGEFESIFGGLWKESTMSYAVYQYFLNGGMDAVIVRVFKAQTGSDEDKSKARFAAGSITFEATSPGVWANDYKLKIDDKVDASRNVPSPHLFNLHILDDAGVEQETFLNISINTGDPRFVKTVLDEESDLLRVSKDNPPINALPSMSDNIVSDKKGDDGVAVTNAELKGENTNDHKTGIYALDKADIFNLLCIPPPSPDGTTAPAFYSEVYATAAKYCQDKRAVLIMDPPSNWNSRDDPISGSIGIDSNTSGLFRHENAAIYFPRIRAPDPNQEGRLKDFAPCGAIAGVMARTDAQRGIWKAPAGIDAGLLGVPDLTVRLTDLENGSINQQGINCLRILPPAGRVVWGARTTKGADNLANQWKYLPVRRTALYIEETLYRNTKWAVFEPNDEPLWSQLRLSIGSFMHDLFRKGAFQGSTPKEAYLVKCDRETTTQYDIDRGIVNILVGFAALKPAEFVIIKIQQLAGQAEVQ
ncbi:phage tail sheath protein FI [Candidatus Nitrososphaera evergladensis SR1]|uniref:Phage tail sheath protein FI n=1 Tax=Candidatus Nitrososphaera evergladensis SR1 TaxID=1459636 RepID=A0A075MM66_9ARCH|nr:phage tail sheath C-terminal domain-containing protein [Candidatus Nitrososphaera evergladensis]AIF82576.1 phage tail sheath protein FI [Candidatus Nitrososphaera evergladensis SR1]